MNESTEAPLTKMESEQEASLGSIVSIDEKYCADLPVDFGNNRYEITFQRVSKVYIYSLSAVLTSLAIFIAIMPLVHHISSTTTTANLIIAGLVFGLVWLINKGQRMTLKLSRKGIAFPDSYKWSLLGRIDRTWSDLHSIKLEENMYSERRVFSIGSAWRQPSVDRFKWTKSGKAESDFMLQLDFISGGNAFIILDQLNRAQCRCLFLAMESWVAQSKLDKDVIKLKHGIISDTEGGSYTDIWMQDLEQRYAITNFTPLVVGQRLADGDYTVISVMSTRGQTAVYLTQDQSGRQLVLKEIASVGPELDQTKEKAREMFHRQADILIKLHHPQIARVVDCFVETGRDYLVLEYIPGKTLRQLVKVQGPRKVDEAIKWLHELLDILHYLHECAPPIVHRDLTPDNIVLKTDGTIAVIDFGAANEFLGTATGTLVGKQSYVSPEQFRGKAHPVSDIYSLGATAYFLVTGANPIPLTESKASAIVSDLPVHLDHFITRCTRLDTTDRFASAIEAKEFLKSKDLARL